jgi:hypothetical protein
VTEVEKAIWIATYAAACANGKGTAPAMNAATRAVENLRSILGGSEFLSRLEPKP